MNESTELVLELGVLLSLDRDRAKQLFAAKQPDVLQAFLQSQLDDSRFIGDGNAIGLRGEWNAFQHKIVDPSLSEDVDRQGLAMTLLGGRPMPGEPSLVVRLVRPDIVRPLSEALARISAEDFGQLCAGSSLPTETAVQILTAVRRLYEQAADRGAAVLFAATTTNANA